MKKYKPSLFLRFQRMISWRSKKRTFDIRPLLRVNFKFCCFTVPDFYIQIFNFFSIGFLAGHHQFLLIFEAGKKQKIFLIGK